MRNPTLGRRLLAASYAQLGGARGQWQAEILTADPSFSVSAYVAKLPETDPDRLADFAEGLRKAGLPE
jgi:hypothetical protein